MQEESLQQMTLESIEKISEQVSNVDKDLARLEKQIPVISIRISLQILQLLKT